MPAPASACATDVRPPKASPSSAVRNGRLVGTLRLWHVSAGGIPALVLGPLAVDASCRKLGVGAALMNHALAAAEVRGHGAVILLGDAPYYARFGFSALKTAELSLPGPFERDRLLGLELREGALDGAWGMIASTGASAPKAEPARAKKALRPVRTRRERHHAGVHSHHPRCRASPPAQHRHHHRAAHDFDHDRQGHIGAPVERRAAVAVRRDRASPLDLARGCARLKNTPKPHETRPIEIPRS